MSNLPQKDPAKRMRTLLGGGGDSPLTRLPQKDEPTVSSRPVEASAPTRPPAHSPVAAGAGRGSPDRARSLRLRKPDFGPAFWTTASLISLTVNLLLLVALLLAASSLGRVDAGQVTRMGSDLLGGLYTNFEKMDRANIATTVQVNTTIPVKFDLLLNQQTNVILSQDVTIDNAVVTVKTGGLNITNAPTTIVLPQGTTLPVVLNLTVPVDTAVPVTLNVPVDIPLSQTQLHEPFTGLQQVIRPFYCLVDPSARNLDDQPVCP